MAPPVGLLLSNEFKVGKLLGKGSFGQVHEVISSKSATDKWVVKLTKVQPNPNASAASSSKKRKKSDDEIACDLLFMEHLKYIQQYRHLCGSIIPQIPLNGVYFNDKDGYRCLVMERMEAPLYNELPSNAAGPCRVGALACKLMDIVQEFHNKAHILVDVKPDNLMVAYGNGSQHLEDRLRLVDLGLVKNYCNGNGHVPNTSTATVQGTPLYCSLNVHDLETPSRRDDVEAMLYVIGEIVLRVGGAKKYDHISYLPWSQQGSDEAIGKAKREHVLDRSSDYYSQMPKAAADILFEALQEIRGCAYSAKPNYEVIKGRLANLQVPKRTKKRAPAKKAHGANTAAARTTTTKRHDESRAAHHATTRRTRSSTEAALDVDWESPPPLAKTRKRSTGKLEESDLDVAMEDAECANESFASDGQDVAGDSMEVDDNEDVEDRKLSAKRKSFRGIKLALQGRGFSKTILLVQGETESIVLGSKPRNNKSDDTVTLPGDSLQGSHVRLTLSMKFDGVQVDKLTKHGSVTVSRQAIPSGTVAFVGQPIGFGEYQVEVQKLSAKEYLGEKGPPKTTTKMASAKPPARASRRGAVAEGNENVAPKKVAKKTPLPDAIIKIVSAGAHSGEQWPLNFGSCIIIGSAPTQEGDKLDLADVDGVEPNHARIDVLKTGETLTFKVTDLKSKGGTYLNRRQIPSGKNMVAFMDAARIDIGSVAMEILRG